MGLGKLPVFPLCLTVKTKKKNLPVLDLNEIIFTFFYFLIIYVKIMKAVFYLVKCDASHCTIRCCIPYKECIGCDFSHAFATTV